MRHPCSGELRPGGTFTPLVGQGVGGAGSPFPAGAGNVCPRGNTHARLRIRSIREMPGAARSIQKHPEALRDNPGVRNAPNGRNRMSGVYFSNPAGCMILSKWSKSDVLAIETDKPQVAGRRWWFKGIKYIDIYQHERYTRLLPVEAFSFQSVWLRMVLVEDISQSML